jgi:hypothetical protein
MLREGLMKGVEVQHTDFGTERLEGKDGRETRMSSISIRFSLPEKGRGRLLRVQPLPPENLPPDRPPLLLHILVYVLDDLEAVSAHDGCCELGQPLILAVDSEDISFVVAVVLPQLDDHLGSGIRCPECSECVLLNLFTIVSKYTTLFTILTAYISVNRY